MWALHWETIRSNNMTTPLFVKQCALINEYYLSWHFQELWYFFVNFPFLVGVWYRTCKDGEINDTVEQRALVAGVDYVNNICDKLQWLRKPNSKPGSTIWKQMATVQKDSLFEFWRSFGLNWAYLDHVWILFWSFFCHFRPFLDPF